MYAGIVPAIILLFLRRGMEEPERFQDVKQRREALRPHGRSPPRTRSSWPSRQSSCSRKELRYSTFIGVLFCLGTLLAIWTSQIWLPTIQTQLLQKVGITGAASAPFVGHGMTLWGLGGILGYATFGFIADAIGRRPAIIFYNVGTIVSGLYLFLFVETWDLYPYLLPVFGYFVFGVFSGHAVYLPELFPTQVRATAVSFCNGTGRVITSFGPLIAGLVTPMLGGQFSTATAIMTCFAGLSILAMLLGRETRGEELPHISSRGGAANIHGRGLQPRTKGMTMAKAYWVAVYRSISNPDALADYAKLAGPAITAAGGKFLVRGTPAKTYEAGLDQRTVVIEFESVAAANAAHDSPGYQAALTALANGAERDIRILEGV